VRALVTGGGGFAGRHLAAELQAQGHAVTACGLAGAGAPPDGARWLDLDVTDAAACRAALARERPEWIFHLAGVAHVGRAEAAPDECLRVNFGGTRAVLAAALEQAPAARVVLASSAEVYGRVPPDALPVTEDQPLRPATIYAASKAAAEMLAHHAAARGLDVVVLRPFNHAGPGQSDDFVTSAFARQLARVEAGRQEPVLRVGNLSAVRDLCDVRDVARAYAGAARAARAGEAYNVTTGRGVPVSEILDTLRALARVPVRVETDPARLRPVDVPVFHGCAEKLARDAGVRLELDLRGMLRDVLDYWRASEAAGSERR
jgi:GDP-4-dehydro-6-deoxy-D-mannose reductase